MKNINKVKIGKKNAMTLNVELSKSDFIANPFESFDCIMEEFVNGFGYLLDKHNLEEVEFSKVVINLHLEEKLLNGTKAYVIAEIVKTLFETGFNINLFTTRSYDNLISNPNLTACVLPYLDTYNVTKKVGDAYITKKTYNMDEI